MEHWDYIMKLNRPPTIDEMDGLLTPEDVANKHRTMVQCNQCGTFNEQSINPNRKNKEYNPCSECGSTNYDSKTTISWRTYPPNKNQQKISPGTRKAVW